MKTVSLIQAEILKVGLLLYEKGLIAGTWGNISARVPGTPWIAVTPSGRNYLTLKADDIIIVDLQGAVITGGLTPSSELPLHLAIYRARPDIKAIVHTHSIFASACAVARKAIPPIIEDLVQVTGGSVDVAQYALPGTVELAQNAVAALDKKNAALLANHGAVGCGGTLDEALVTCELVEKSAQIYIYASQIGGAQLLSRQDVAKMHEFYLQHYRERVREDSNG